MPAATHSDAAASPGGGTPSAGSPGAISRGGTPGGSPGSFLPSGEQWAIAHGRQQAIVTEIGATLRAYTVDGVPVIDGFAEDEWSQSGRGQVLAPWPNRLGDGRYEFRGVTAQAALDEPEHANAIHGLVRWMTWRCKAHAQNIVVLGCDVHPTPGYPFRLALSVEYRLGRSGLVVTTTATNPGAGTGAGSAGSNPGRDLAIPFGLGFHPYLRCAGGPVAVSSVAATSQAAAPTPDPETRRIDSAVLTLPARQRLVLDDRSLPTGEVRPVAGTELDFTAGRSIGATKMDTAFTALDRDAEGRATATLVDPASGRRVELWVDEHFDYLMAYTGDTLPDVVRRRTALAIEPMTCPPDALRSGNQLVVLGSAEQWTGSWGISVR